MNSIFIILALLVVAGIFIYAKTKHKRLKLPNVFLITGGVKTGKSALSVSLACKEYKKTYRHVYLQNVFAKMFFKPLRELPMLYSNIPLAGVKYNPVTKDILQRKVRIPNKSVVLLDEVSLVADSQLFKDKTINEELMLFIKLWGHYSHGGYLIVNTQSLSDCHYSFKRVISNYLFIHNKVKLPFFTLFKVREMVHNEDNDVMNSFDSDVEDSLKTLIVWNKCFKQYDCYCYSCFTDDLAVYVDYDNEIKSYKDSLKSGYIVSFQEFKTILKKEGVENNESK